MEHLLDQLGRALAHLPGQPHAQLLFQGVLFFVVFTAVYALYTLLGKTKARVYILLGFSLYFYYKFSGWFVFLLIGTGGLGLAAGPGHSPHPAPGPQRLVQIHGHSPEPGPAGVL